MGSTTQAAARARRCARGASAPDAWPQRADRRRSGSSSTRAPSARSCACTASTDPSRAGGRRGAAGRARGAGAGGLGRARPVAGAGARATRYAARLADATARARRRRRPLAVARPAGADRPGRRARRRHDRAGRRLAAGARRLASAPRRPRSPAAFALAYVIDLAAEPRPRRAPAAGEAVRGRGLRALEQLVVRAATTSLGYSVLFPPLAAAAHAAARRRRSRRRRPRRCSSRWPAVTSARTRGSGRCGSAPRPRRTCSPGRLTFAFGLLPAVGDGAGAAATAARGSRRCSRSLTALRSPVAALFAALAGAAYAIGAYVEQRPRARAVVPGRRRSCVASLAPVGAARDRVPRGRHRAVRVRDAVADPA